MAGRIRDEDVALVKERVNIADVIAEHVTLRNAGGGNLKGLCPFHDEKTPSFSVRPAVGSFHCFGCGEGGDAISFVMKLEHLSFAETVERLAAKAGITLRYDEGGGPTGLHPGRRARLVAAHRAAAEFYAEALASPEAAPGRAFLAERGFDREVAARFGVGWAPTGWDALARHLRGRGYDADELVTAGLVRQGQRGPIDYFRGRLLWPIRDIRGDVVGFGARRLLEEDRIAAKYVNTPETPIYKKSQVLYGLDLARKPIATTHQAVIVEGYTDVMACHLAGVQTAVATCGTAFGQEHIKVLRRLLMDTTDALGEMAGEVVFTFDGDAAGQKAALRAFADDQRFVAQTFVAVEPSGMDPCELRQHRGDDAVRALVAARVPLFEFVIRTTLRKHDLEIPEGRVAALRSAAPIVAAIRDRSLRPEYARRLAGWLGMEVAPVLDAVSRAARTRPGAPAGHPSAHQPDPAPEPPTPAIARPDPRDPATAVERESLKAVLQLPALAAGFDALPASCFTSPAYAAVRAVVAACGGVAAAGAQAGWVDRVRTAAADPPVAALVTELAVEPLRADTAPDGRYVAALLARLEELDLTRGAADLHSRLQRLDATEDADAYAAVFSELVALETRRRDAHERAAGSG
ncbi:MAG TPA: DNA primase [Actinomycetes bacterium]|nr:DNA primase [Actinomycetes bacterium]